MNIKLKILTILLLFIYSCSYLPEDYAVDQQVNYTETTEYIKLSPKNGTKSVALIFVPGGFVDPHAYISILQRTAVEGLEVYILKVSANLAILEIQKSVKLVKQLNESRKWYLAGHSLGGITAQAVVEKNPEMFNGLIFFGVYPSKSYSLATWNKNVLSVYAENDQLSTIAEVEANMQFLPKAIKIDSTTDLALLQTDGANTMYYMIKGGNHSQFGNYGFQKGDGTATISAEEQHSQIAAIFTKFITWNENK